MGRITVAGIGPGSKDDITPAVLEAVGRADVVVGYKYYFRFIEPYLKPGCQCIDTGMKRERERARQALDLARSGRDVVVISSGDAGIYGMAPLMYEMMGGEGREVRGERNVLDSLQLPQDADVSSHLSPLTSHPFPPIVTLPGISAFQKAASILGCPMGHDFCVLSLSDLMTPWETIERRIRSAALGDFVTAVYNPKSHGRYWQLYRLRELFLQEGRSQDTPVGIVRQAGREDESVTLTTLGQMDPEQVDMFTVVIIGNSQSYVRDGRFITPRGYYKPTPDPSLEGRGEDTADSVTTPLPSREGLGVGLGRSIMIQSFRTIRKELTRQDYGLGHLWALLHAIHTTADFEMEQRLLVDPGAVETLYNKVRAREVTTIVTDVTMVVSGIRKGALQRLGVEARCYLSDPRVADMARDLGITRTQAGIRLAVAEHPTALYAFGNAPTALMELCDLIRQGKARPSGIIAAPVGFVHVCESKHMVKPFRHIPKLIVEGRKGGSNLAATLCNAILTFDDAEQLRPGRDL